MCVVSAVMDGFQPLIPQPTPWPGVPTPFPLGVPTAFPLVPWGPPMPVTDLGELLRAFHAAVEAAKKADALTNQKDCADPEKVKLEERVAELERRLAALESRQDCVY